MPLFFIISGIIAGIKCQKRAEKSTESAIEVKKSVHRLALPYFTWSFLYLIVIFIQNHSLNLERLWAVLSLRGIAPIWFLAALFISELVFWTILSDKKNKTILIAALLLFVFTMCFSSWFSIQKTSLEIYIQYPMVFLGRQMLALLFFIVGYECSILKLSANMKRFIVIFILMAFFFFSVTFNAYINMHAYAFENVGLFILTGITGSISIISICKIFNSSFSFLSWLGQNSFDLMMLHYPPLPNIIIAGIILAKISLKNNILLSFIITLILSITFSKVLNQIRSFFMIHNINLHI